jgi:hypothetical protein
VTRGNVLLGSEGKGPGRLDELKTRWRKEKVDSKSSDSKAGSGK